MKIHRWLALVAILVMVAAACGDSGDDGTTTTTPPGTDATTPDTEPMDFEAMSVSAPDCDYGGEFQTIEAVDERTVRFVLCFPDVAFASKVAFAAFGIHPTEHLEATGGGGPELVDNPIGTGPYQLRQWAKGDQLVLEANANYWGPAPEAETLVFRWSSEAAQRLVELQAGTVDGIDNPGRDDFAVIEGDSDLQLLPREGTNIFYVGINNTVPPFDQEPVRQALAKAIDRQRLVDNFYPPGSTVADQFLPKSIFGYTPEPTWYEYDPDAALQELTDLGFGLDNPIETTISYRDVVRSYLPTPGTVAVDIQDQLAQVGINVEINQMESGAFLDAADAGDLSLHLLGWGADYPDATNFLDFHFGRGASDQFGEGFEDIWTTLESAGRIADEAQRLEFYEQATQLIKDHVPMVPIAHGGSGVAYRADVTNAQASPLGNEYFAVMDPGGRDTFVWMQNAEPIGLYCADETDGESLRACEQINESLLFYEIGGTAVEPGLAESFTSNEDGTEWTFTLREGVTFHDGSTLDANDVVMSYLVQWDAANPLHVGRDGNFTYFNADFGSFLNAPEG